MKNFHIALLLVLGVCLTACSSKFQKAPIDDIIRDMPEGEVFSIILHDMDAEGTFSYTYYHQYQLIVGNDENIESELTEWIEVSEEEFNKYVNDMGMEIAARDSTGTLTKSVAPPGYNNYIGNRRYGSWHSSGGQSFWVFYGQYAFMSSMFRLATWPVNRGYYDGWRGSTGTYYGPGGTYYGTSSAYNQTRNTSSTWNSKPSSFRDQVRSRASRSTGRTGTSSSSRSRSGGFGK